HHFAETMIHDRKTPIGGEHAQAVRHVVQGGVELAGKSLFSEARRQRFYEDGMKTDVDMLQAHEEQHQQHGQADVVESAMERQRERHRPAREENMQLNKLRAAVIAGRAAGGVTYRHGDAEHMRDRIVVAENGYEAPGAEHPPVKYGADRVARLPILRLLERQH